MRPILLLMLLLMALPSTAIDSDKVDAALRDLDQSLSKRQLYCSKRQHYIDSLTALYNADSDRQELLMQIGRAYTGFDNDSALTYFRRGTQLPSPQNLPYKWELASLLPLGGFFETAVSTFDSIDVSTVPDSLLASYYDAGRQMHSYIAAFFRSYPDVSRPHEQAALDMQARLLLTLPKDSPEYRFNEAEYHFLNGRTELARVLLGEVLESSRPHDKLRARAAHHLSSIAKNDSDTEAYTYYLAVSANADVMSATREVASLQELGTTVYAAGDIARAHTYLSSALENAVECGAPLRMIETSRSLPIIERAHSANLAANRRTIYYIIGAMSVLMLVLITVLLVLRHEMHRMAALQENLRTANTAKEVYISQFLQLCSIYMDKLNQFCKIATRKLAAGQADELYRMTRSGKFVEEQSRDFYEVFDNAFLHIYPGFVSQVNALLRPDAQITLAAGEMLNTDLRILAFMRLGIEESARIAQILNYSLNTIYSYRNRLKARAINRDTFEDDIMKIDSIG